jgi:class 3 adenylate cyclase/tetratricopeptide (TPR) repeat protein
MITCAVCGRDNPEGSRFCNNCGSRLGGVEERREERKVVTVVFADLVGFTSRSEHMDPEDVRRLLDAYWERLRDELERHGGTIEKFIGDAVMALFGAPIAHEDDPERAVRAAIAIRDSIREDGGDIQVRIGVNTGEALVLLEARPAEGEGMAAGDVVNTAARLQANAPVNGILVGEITHRATRHGIEYAEHEPIVAKGKSEPVPAWEVVDARSRIGVDVARQTRAPLVGRDYELSLLRDTLARVEREAEPRLVSLVGVPGIGKSRLVAELLELVRAQPELVYWRQGRCLPYGDGVSFWALGEMVKAHAGILESDSPERARERLAQAVEALLPDDPQAAWVELRLCALLGLGSDGEISSDRRAESFAAWRRFLEAMTAQRPLVLVFEDLHWADEGLLDFVDYLLEWVSDEPLLVVTTARPELLERRPGWGTQKPSAVALTLGPLSDEATARLIGALLDRSVMPADTQSELLARAGGNPLYAEQFAYLLEERGKLDEVPETVQGIIAARIDGLSPAEKSVVQDAAVIGKVFWVGAVAALGGRGREEVESLLSELELKELVLCAPRSSVGQDLEYAFRHVLVRDVAYAQIPRLGRARKHSAAAAWIETLGRVDDQAEMLAHHYMASLELSRGVSAELGEAARNARHALRRAGERALALSSFEAAASFYRQALELAPPDHEAHEHHLQLGRALRWTEADDRARELEDAIERVLAAGNVEGAAELEAILGEVLWHAGLSDDARGHLARAHELVADRPDSPAKAAVLSQLSRFHALAGEPRQAIQVGTEALSLAERFGLVEVQAHALNNVALAHAHSGEEDLAVASLEQAAELAESATSPEAGRAYLNLGTIVSGLGDMARAAELWAASREVAERFGVARELRFIRGLEVWLAFVEGRWEECRALCDEFVDECEQGDGHYLEANVRGVRSLLRLAADDVTGALADVEAMLPLARAAHDPQVRVPCLTFATCVRAELGRIDEAEELARELADQLRGGEHTVIATTAGIVWLVDELGIRSELEEALDRAGTTSRWVEAIRIGLEGDLGGMAEVLEEIGAISFAARARLAAVEGLLRRGNLADADVQARRALGFYREVGAGRYVREAEALLRVSA